jgi:hypothetical protein
MTGWHNEKRKSSGVLHSHSGMLLAGIQKSGLDTGACPGLQSEIRRYNGRELHDSKFLVRYSIFYLINVWYRFALMRFDRDFIDSPRVG